MHNNLPVAISFSEAGNGGPAMAADVSGQRYLWSGFLRYGFQMFVYHVVVVAVLIART